MNIIIPLAGKGERFKKEGYKEPKPLIKIFNKYMIEYIIDNLTIDDEDNVFIIYNEYLDQYNFSNIISEKYSYINCIKIGNTKGAAETLYIGIQNIFKKYNYAKKTLVVDCDTFYTADIKNIFKNKNENVVFFVKNHDINPIFSYIEVDSNNKIIKIQEKIKISDNANTGAYAFNDIENLYLKCYYVLKNNITFNGEPYTSCVLDVMINNNENICGIELNTAEVFNLGTPKQLNDYIKNTYAFLFDLDGTIILTDEIYYKVWEEILKKYNIKITEEIFKKYIQGNNDNYVKNVLLKNIVIPIN